MRMSNMAATRKIISIPAHELLALSSPPPSALLTQIHHAFGQDPSCLGILQVTQISELFPDFQNDRVRLLSAGRQFALMSKEVQSKYERPDVNFGLGWSRGTEKFMNRPDDKKGSFYANICKGDSHGKAAKIEKPEDRMVWPDEECPALRSSFMQMSKSLYSLGIRVAELCDMLVQSINPRYAESNIARLLRSSQTHVGRLLYYYPKTQVQTHRHGKEPDDDWCGMHADHGALTALLPSILYQEPTADVLDQGKGLFIVPHDGQLVNINLDADAIGFQLGEAAQILSHGVLRATPHMVRQLPVHDASKESRATFALFLQPDNAHVMKIQDAKELERVYSNAYDGIPQLQDRFMNGDTFGAFSKRTNAMYESVSHRQQKD